MPEKSHRLSSSGLFKNMWKCYERGNINNAKKKSEIFIPLVSAASDSLPPLPPPTPLSTSSLHSATIYFSLSSPRQTDWGIMNVSVSKNTAQAVTHTQISAEQNVVFIASSTSFIKTEPRVVHRVIYTHH